MIVYVLVLALVLGQLGAAVNFAVVKTNGARRALYQRLGADRDRPSSPLTCRRTCWGITVGALEVTSQ